jgi:hypothetical protein
VLLQRTLLAPGAAKLRDEGVSRHAPNVTGDRLADFGLPRRQAG